MLKSRYKVDLRGLHALCDANYVRLLRLFPDYESCNSRRFSLPWARIQIDVLERSRYTTLFRLQSYRAAASTAPAAPTTNESAVAAPPQPEPASEHAVLENGWVLPLRLEARAYHDAGMLEVVTFQSEARTAARYDYPNRAMHQEDEKRQQNAFLADWLAHCLHHGQADLNGSLPRGTEPA
ncbi:MAG: DUF1249 domain-containing protein [Pseudomonadota bacterium]